jgi:aryl-alcohol dehydrogenase-like predicted oxidoreductase
MKQPRADSLLETLIEYGVNHIDTAASYGDAELRIAPWMQRHRDRFFLATKTTERSYAGAREGLRRSLERLAVDRLDLVQLHNLVEPQEWETAMGPGGALEAAVEAREEGRVRFIGVTGHGTRAAEMHLRSLERFAFDSVLLPYSFAMMSSPEYARDFEALFEVCEQRGVAVQTIKSIARRRWVDDAQPRFSWYEPLKDPPAIRHSVRWVLRRPGVFLNTSSDATLLRDILEAASQLDSAPSDGEMRQDVSRLGIEPLFVRGVSDRI